MTTQHQSIYLKQIRKYAESSFIQLNDMQVNFLYTSIQGQLSKANKLDSNDTSLLIHHIDQLLHSTKLDKNPNHLLDVYLLKNQATDIAIKYKPLIERRVDAIISGNYNFSDREELIQLTQVKLLEKLSKGKLDEPEKAQFRTYLNTVINHLIIDVLRKKRPTIVSDQYLIKEEQNLFNQIAWNDFLEILTPVTAAFFHSLNREDWLKTNTSFYLVLTGRSFTQSILDQLFPEYNVATHQALLYYFGDSYSDKKLELFSNLSSCLEREAMIVSGASIERFYNRKRLKYLATIEAYIVNYINPNFTLKALENNDTILLESLIIDYFDKKYSDD